MKNAKILFKFQNEKMNAIVDGIIIESFEDIELFGKELSNAEQSVMVKFVKSKESTDRLNHIIGGFRPLEKSIARLALARGKMKGENPIYELGMSTASYLNTVNLVFVNHGVVFINSNGTVTNMGNNMEILETSVFDGFPNPPKYFIEKGSKVINLENDYELEEDAVKFMTKRFNKFSYIKDMKTYDEKDFEKVFSEFVSNGGENVYVYTTGMDYEQMYEYTTSAIKCGLKQFIFDFNSGMDSNINEFITWLKQRAEVELINEI